MLKLPKPELFQWDSNLSAETDGKYLDYSGTTVTRVAVTNGASRIPDEWLQTAGTKTIWVCMADNTRHAHSVYVKPRPCPPDYASTPTQKVTFDGLVETVNELVEDVQDRIDAGEFTGPKGDKGAKGDKGDQGDDYVLTDDDKSEIAALVPEKICIIDYGDTDAYDKIDSASKAGKTIVCRHDSGISGSADATYAILSSYMHEEGDMHASFTNISGIGYDYAVIKVYDFVKYEDDEDGIWSQKTERTPLIANGKGLSSNDYTDSDKAKVAAIPTKTSQLTNDSGFLTEHQFYNVIPGVTTCEEMRNAILAGKILFINESSAGRTSTFYCTAGDETANGSYEFYNLDGPSIRLKIFINGNWVDHSEDRVTQDDFSSALGSKQAKLTAGDYVTISNANVIDAKPATYTEINKGGATTSGYSWSSKYDINSGVVTVGNSSYDDKIVGGNAVRVTAKAVSDPAVKDLLTETEKGHMRDNYGIASKQDLVNYQTVLTDAQKLAISKKWFENTLTAEEQEMARTAIGAVKKSGYTELLNTATTEEKQFVYNFGTTWYSSIRVRIVFPICSTGIVYRYTKMFGSSGNSVMTYPTSGNTGSFSNHLYFENSDGFLESHYIRSVTASTETSGFYTHDDFTFNPDFGRCTKLESLVNYPVGTTIQIWAKI